MFRGCFVEVWRGYGGGMEGVVGVIWGVEGEVGL